MGGGGIVKEKMATNALVHFLVIFVMGSSHNIFDCFANASAGQHQVLSSVVQNSCPINYCKTEFCLIEFNKS